DFGSTPTLFQKSGCPPQLVVVQKNGSLYLYDRDTIASGYRQRIAVGQPSLIGVVGYSEATKLLYVVNPKGSVDGVYKPGLVAFRLTSACNLAPAWQTPAAIGIGSTPTIAAGVVYFAGGFSGKVYALDAVTGAELWNTGTTVTGPILAAPTVFNGRLYVAGYDGQLHAYRL
ncbi:MAG: hypothetical protein QOI55_56, partial [Actinomycetota bacterium]|nr:hypothetical protein [Actinomycetota bacterium]